MTERINLAPVCPTIHVHPSGLFAEHDYSCPICVERKAIYHMNDGRFNPCWKCQRDGWEFRRKGWFRRWLDRSPQPTPEKDTMT